MSTSARVGSIDALKDFRARLVKFAQSCRSALADAESDASRTLAWLSIEQKAYWESQFRKRTTELAHAQELLRHKRLFKTFDGTEPSIVDEQKAVVVAQRRQAEAAEKIKAVKHNTLRLEKELLLYRGQTQRFETILSGEVPVAVADLNGLIIALENYAALEPEWAGAESGDSGGLAGVGSAGEESASMARASTEGAGESGLLDNSEPAASEVNSRRAAWRPAPDDRTAAELVDSVELPGLVSAVAPISKKDRTKLSELMGSIGAEPAAGRVTVGTGMGPESGQRVLLERFVPVGPGDSGWYLGPIVTDAKVECRSVQMVDLLALRPDWAAMLTLPAGFAVIMSAGSIAVVLDSQDRNRWPVPSDL